MSFSDVAELELDELVENLREDQSPIRVVSYYEYCRIKTEEKFAQLMGTYEPSSTRLYYARYGIGF